MSSTLGLDVLPEMVERLVHHFDPQQIVLFGSWARGTASRRSDIDLLIVCETEAPPLERVGQVLQVLWDAPLPVEAIVYTPEDLRASGDRPFIRQILEEGQVLYRRA